MPREYAALEDYIREIFRVQATVSISYNDHEGDLLTIQNDEDLLAAFDYAARNALSFISFAVTALAPLEKAQGPNEIEEPCPASPQSTGAASKTRMREETS